MKMPSSKKKRAYQVYKAAKETVGTSTAIYALSVEPTQCFQDLMKLI